jgi:DNA-binding response OmpR family regulator
VFVRSRNAFFGHNYYSFTGENSLSNNRKNTKLLIITNDLHTCESLNLALNPYQFQIRSVPSFTDGEKIADQFNPDVILLDLWSPSSGGIDACARVRAFSSAPILVLSTNNKPGIVENMLNAGADECLIKPAPTNILIAHLKTLARRYRVEIDAKVALNKISQNDIKNNLLHASS